LKPVVTAAQMVQSKSEGEFAPQRTIAIDRVITPPRTHIRE
jgi:hypothetical protein